MRNPRAKQRGQSLRLVLAAIALVAALFSRTTHAAVDSGAGAPLQILPTSVSLAIGGMQTFMGLGGVPPYTWSVTTNASGGQITPNGGVYTAGMVAGMDVVTVTDAAGHTATADVSVTMMMIPIGTYCTLSSACPVGSDGSRHCIDGVCCTTACGGQCQACNVSGSVGTCTTVSGPPVGSTGSPPTRPACPQSDMNNPCTSKICDGTNPNACTSLVGPTTTCGVASCIDGVGTPGAACTGDGGCEVVAPASCGTYACIADQCATACYDTSYCSPGNYCDIATDGGHFDGGVGKCVAPPPLPPDGGTAGKGKSGTETSGGCSIGGDTSVDSPLLFLGALVVAGGRLRRRRAARSEQRAAWFGTCDARPECGFSRNLGSELARSSCAARTQSRLPE